MPGEIIVKFRASVHDAVKGAFSTGGFARTTGRLETASIDALNAKYGVHEPRLHFPPSLPRKARTLHETKVAERRQRMLQADSYIEGLYLLKVSDTTIPIEEICRKYSAEPNAVYAEPNYMVSIQTTPNDPRFNELWGCSHNSI